jgi:predicted PurR-regulated permease PerM
MKPEWASRPYYVKLACILICLLAIGYLSVQGKRLLSPMIFACLFSILLLPLAKFFEYKCKFSRNMAALSSVLLMIIFFGSLFYFLGAQISRLVGDWPLFREQLANAGREAQEWVSQKFHVDVEKQANYVHKATSKVLDSGTVVAGATLYSVSSVLLFLSFTFVYTFFFLWYRGLIIKFLIRVFLEKNSELVRDIVEEIQFIIRKYVTGILIEMTIVSSAISIIFSLLGIKYAVLLGLITGLFNIIPYIGMLTAMIISAMITFATTAATAKVIWIVAVMFGVHVIDYNILLPVIVGSKVKINAMVTLFGIIVGEMLWGIAGMFLSIPVIAVTKIIFDRVEALKSWGFLMGEEPSARTSLLKRRKKRSPSLEEKMEEKK